jgi:hypothetical protein
MHRRERDESHTRRSGQSVLRGTMTHQFMYPKVTPIGTAGPHRPQGTPSGTRRGTVTPGR